jgi:hypothetical protein
MDPATVVCPREVFCCRAGATCTRDAAGNATCLDSTTSVNITSNTNTSGIDTDDNSNIIKILSTNSGTMGLSPTHEGGLTNNNNNNNVNNNIMPSIDANLGLIVALAILAAFLVTPLTVSHKN